MAGKLFSLEPVKVPYVDTKYRKIKTAIPVPESIPMLEKLYAMESRSMHGQLPVIWDRADGFQVQDDWGNKWIDFTSTIFVANAGHGNKKIRESLRGVLDKPLLHTYTYASSERINYLEYLIKNTPKKYEKALLLSAGTEATEVALKLMRLHAKKVGKRSGGIICFDGAFHGRTMGAQMMTGSRSGREWIGYQDPNIHHLQFPNLWLNDVSRPEEFLHRLLDDLAKEKALDLKKDLCGVMLETFQGWSALFYPMGFVQEIMKFARENKMLVAFDEMQAGFGRTGKLFGYMHYEVEPDLLCCGKGASSGLPLAIVLGAAEVMDLPDVGEMSSTHSANPLVCVGGHANLRALLEDGLIGNSEELGIILFKALNQLREKYQNVLKFVHGRGLLAALVFLDNDHKPLSGLCDAICETSMRKVLLFIHTGRESIKLAPPLTINEEALLEGIEVLDASIGEVLQVVR